VRRDDSRLPAVIAAAQRRPATTALVAGVVATAALDPWRAWPAFFLGLGVLYGLLAPLPPGAVRRAALVGWCFGFGWFVAGLWWIANALLVPGYPFRWVWPVVVGALPAVLAVFPALACAVTVRFFSLRRVSGWLAFVASMTLVEWLRGHLFSGFPWNLYAYVWSGVPALMQSAAIGGSWLLCFLTLVWAAAPAFALVQSEARATARLAVPLVAAATLAGTWLWGDARLRGEIADVAGVRVHVVQPNVPQSDKADPRKAEQILATLADVTARDPEPNGTVVVVWPETAVTSETLAAPRVRQGIAAALSPHATPTYLVTGVLRRAAGPRGRDRYFNSVLVLDRAGRTLATYDKTHLVPFAEHVPLRRVLGLAPYVSRIEGFTAGTGPATLAVAGAPAFGPAVCYEVVLPGGIVARGAARPGWIVNVTNDAWYGDSPGPYQHFAQARFRAVEEGLPVVRSANSGLSGVIDAFGRVVVVSGLFEATAVSAALPGALPPTLYARYGDAPVLAVVAITALVAAALRPRPPS
jgi:apolipoprotein N-acyltransferase